MALSFRLDLLKEYVKNYEKRTGEKWNREILAMIAQIGPDHPFFKKAPEDVYYDIMDNEKLIEKEEPDPQQIRVKGRVVFNGREFSKTMFPKYE